MSRATEVCSRELDSIFLDLSPRIRALIEAKTQFVGSRLDTHLHHRLQGRSEYRLRVGDYRVIYEFDQQRNILYLVTLGHRRDVYR